MLYIVERKQGLKGLKGIKVCELAAVESQLIEH